MWPCSHSPPWDKRTGKSSQDHLLSANQNLLSTYCRSVHNNQRHLISPQCRIHASLNRVSQFQIMVCRLFGTKPLSEQTFRYSQELSPGPLVYRNKLQWNFNQNRKRFIHGNASEYIVCEMAAILSRVGGGGGGGGVGCWGDGLTERELSMLSDHRNAFSIIMFGLIFTSFIWTFYWWSRWHWIEYLNIIDVIVWVSLAAIAWAKGNQYVLCCYEATMNSSASAWLVLLWNGDKGGVDWVNWLLFVSTYERYINSVRLGSNGWYTLQPTLQFLPRTYICNATILNFVPHKWNCIGEGNDLAHNRIQDVT